MNSVKLLQRLKALSDQIESLKSQEQVIAWANKVLPLLKYSSDYYLLFSDSLQKIYFPFSVYILSPAWSLMRSQLEQAINEIEYKIEDGILEIDNKGPTFISKDRIFEISKLDNKEYDYKMLIQILNEMNIASENKAYLSIIALTRMLIDHVPPLFGFSSFTEVANNYPKGTRTFKDHMKRLDTTARSIADQYLHTRIREKEELPTFIQVDFRSAVDVLLMEIIRIKKTT